MLGENIKAARVVAGFSQQDLADMLHVVRQTVPKWEKGTSVPDAELLSALAKSLNVSVSALLGEEVRLADDLHELAIQSTLQNEQLTILTARFSKLMTIVKRALIVGACVVAILGAMWFINEAFVPKPGHAIYINYEIDGRTEMAQIWLDPRDTSIAVGYGLDSGEIAETIFVGDGSDTFQGFLGKTGGATMILHAFEVAIESHGGEIISVSAYDYPN